MNYKKRIAFRDSSALLAERVAAARATEIVNRERSLLYPSVTPANVAEVLAWQEKRFADLAQEGRKLAQAVSHETD